MIKSILIRKLSPTLMQAAAGIGYNLLSIFFSILQIAILLKYLGKESYGIWITLYSVCNWIAFLDGGLGNGVRNHLTSALVNNNILKARKIISTGYLSIMYFLICLYVLLVFLHFFIDWNVIIGSSTINFNILALFLFGFFLMQMVLKLISKIYFSFDKASLSFLTPAITNFIILILLYFLYYLNIENRLWNVGLVFSLVPLVVFLLFTVHFFLFIAPNYKPSIKLYDKYLVKSILSQGAGFFLIQMSAGVLQSVVPIFITLWFAVELTADYQISMRYYSILLVLLNIILQTLWSPITKSYLSKDEKKLLKYMKIKLAISFSMIGILVLMWLLSGFVYKLWLGKDFIVSPFLDLICAIFVGSLVLSKSFINFLNATGNIKIQSIISASIIILYFPLIYIAVKILNLGMAGLILTPTIFFVIQTIIAAIQLKKLIKV